jgi:aspartate kinase
VALVCSARSGSIKALGTTNLLLRASSEALQRPTHTTSNGKISETPGTGSITPISRGLFGLSPPTPSTTTTGGGGNGGAVGLDEASLQSSPMTPHMRSNFGFGSPGIGFMMSPIINSKSSLNGGGEGPEFVGTVDLLKQEHVTAARECVTRHPEILRELEEEIQRDCDWLTSFLYALKVCLFSKQ